MITSDILYIDISYKFKGTPTLTKVEFSQCYRYKYKDIQYENDLSDKSSIITKGNLKESTLL